MKYLRGATKLFNKQVLSGFMFIMVWLLIAPVHAVILEANVDNNVFHDLSDVTNNFDLGEATVGQNDTYSGVIGTIDRVSFEDVDLHGEGILEFDDLDFWTFDLHVGTPFRVTFANLGQPDHGEGEPVSVLYQYINGAFNPVAGASGLQNLITFNPWQSGRYFFGISGSNNSPFNEANAILTSSAQFASLQTQTASPLGHFFGRGDTSFSYMLTMEGVFEPTPLASAVPVPAAAWLLASGLVGLGWTGRRRKN